LTTHDGQLKQKNGESSVKVMTRFVPLTFQGIETTAPTWEMPTLRVCLPRSSYFVGEVIRGMIVLSSSVDQIFAEALLLQLVGEQRIQAVNMEDAIEKRVFYHETRQLLDEPRQFGGLKCWHFSVILPPEVFPSINTGGGGGATVQVNWTLKCRLLGSKDEKIEVPLRILKNVPVGELAPVECTGKSACASAQLLPPPVTSPFFRTGRGWTVRVKIKVYFLFQ
jgi:hypothetical protein